MNISKVYMSPKLWTHRDKTEEKNLLKKLQQNNNFKFLKMPILQTSSQRKNKTQTYRFQTKKRPPKPLISLNSKQFPKSLLELKNSRKLKSILKRTMNLHLGNFKKNPRIKLKSKLRRHKSKRRFKPKSR